MYMDATANHDNIVCDYFISWQNHDIGLLNLIFDSQSVYVILPKTRIYKGIDEISNYWDRNRIRQKDLIISWDFLNKSESIINTEFSACFYDNEEGKYNKIEGIIQFIFNSNVIVYLSENYIKFTKDNLIGK
jgi:hypothetical protein